MARACRFQFHLGPFRTAFLALLMIVCASATANASTKAGHMYLLAGTPTNDAPETFPVTLYTTGPHHGLQLVRVIVPAKKGLCGVAYDLESSVYVAYPHMVPTAVSVIDLRRPLPVDEVGFNSKSLPPVDNFFAASAGPLQPSHALYLAWAAQQPSKRRSVTTLTSVSARSSGSQPQVKTNQWVLFKSLAYEGCPGGPTFCVGPKVSVAKGQILIREGANLVPILGAPPALAGIKGSEAFRIVAASPRFFIISPVYTGKALDSGAVRTAPMFVLNKASGIWRTVVIPCNLPRSRLLGVWLATIVQDDNPKNRNIGGNGVVPAGDNNPGLKNERVHETLLLPGVREWYAAFVGNFNIIPGKLILDDLKDGRRIIIHTGQEDSEILDVRKDGLVFYRVNNEIFSARIEGDKLSAPKLVVKGEDVPEVHWVFWSKAGTEGQASAANVQTLLAQLESRATSNEAAEKLAELGKARPGVREYLSNKLPPLIERARGLVWVNAVRLAGNLKLQAAAPVLAPYLEHWNTIAGVTDFAVTARFGNDPAGKAPVEIGQASVSPVAQVLESGDRIGRWRADRILVAIGSPAAIQALRSHIPKEKDPHLKQYIASQLRSHGAARRAH